MLSTKMEKKEKSRERILESAGSLVRKKGVSAASVADVMEGAGMTVGGFYAHFPSKQALMVEALRDALRRSRTLLVSAAGARKGAEWANEIARSYLSRTHRDNPQAGCPLPATLGELAREDTTMREAIAEEIGGTADEIALHLKDAGLIDPESEALAMLATMVGGLTIARALRGTKISDAMLKACRCHIERSLSSGD
jgi:TetR/AcrR family transcriptional regulator, transcriptional repressor for nem operon